MRTLIKAADYSFVNGTRTIAIANNDSFVAGDIRLIVNETQKKVITSSMQKDLITVAGANITYSSSLPALVTGDVLTIEIDFGIPTSVSMVADVADGKELIADAIVARGGTALPTDSFQTLADEIGTALLPDVNVTPLTNYPDSWHDLFTVMAAVYDPSYPYMYALLLDRNTTPAVLAMFGDGTVVTLGGELDAGKVTRWVVFKRATQSFSATYNITFRPFLYGIAVYNADIKNVSFYGSYPTFLYYNSGYTVTTIEYTLYQFAYTSIAHIVIPSTCLSLVMNSNYSFYYARLCSFTLPEGLTSIIINGNLIWAYSTLVVLKFPSTLTTLTINGSQPWLYMVNLVSLIFPPLLASLTLGANFCMGCISLSYVYFPSSCIYISFLGNQNFLGCTALTTFSFPPTVTHLLLGGGYHWSGCTALSYVFLPNATVSFLWSTVNTFYNCTSLTVIEFGVGWKWTIDLGSAYATLLTHDTIVNLQFAKLIDKRADGVNASTVTSSTSSAVITGVNSQFTKVFVPTDTISIDGGANLTILSIQSDTQLTLTTNSNKNGAGLAYNIKKTLTLGATNLARVSAGEIAVATDKGWTIA